MLLWLLRIWKIARYFLFHNANVLLTESIEKRKTALHRIVEFQGFVFSILSEIIDIYLGLIGREEKCGLTLSKVYFY